MKEENNSAAGVWVAVTGLILLYLLSPGPLRLLYQSTHRQPPKWISKIYYPLEALYDRNESVKAAYDFYFKAIGVR